MKKNINPIWGGRFKTRSSKLLQDINNSINFDYKLALEDLKVSIAYSKALSKAKIINKSEQGKIEKALKEIQSVIEKGTFKFRAEFEDIHMNVEMELKNKIGKVAGKLHTGRSRNDQVTTDLKMWIKKKSLLIVNALNNFQKTLLKKAEKNIYVIMPGFTHLQHAQPISFAHYLMALFEMFQRDKERFKSSITRMDECPLGSGALAGTNFSEIDRQFLAKELGFLKPSENSLDSVSDRDYAIEFLSNISISSMHFSRLSEDLIIWGSNCFSFVSFSETFSTGSSIMPQKKNPDAAELVRSKTSRIYGNLLSLLTTLKGLPMSYSKDLQEDKEPVFDSFHTIEIIILVMTNIIEEIIINKKEMYDNSKKGFSTATDLADWLVKNTDLPFREAHHKTGEIVLLAEKKGCMIDQLSVVDLKKIEPKISEDIFTYLKVNDSVKNKKSYGGTSFSEIKKAIKRAKKKIKI